jgi:NADPH2:quinone reductase
VRAVTIAQFGDAGVLRVQTLDVPEPGPGAVAIDVAFAGVNFADVLVRRGVIPVELPYVPGVEVAGHVRALGAGVEGLRAGQPVAALAIGAGGGYAEVAIADARLVAPLPEPADPALLASAALTANSTTALLILQRVARLRAGESVLVHAAAGGVGGQLGQVAKLLGAGRVVGTVGSRRRIADAGDCGYDDVVVREGSAGRIAELGGPGGFDVVIDPIGDSTRRTSFDVLAPGGRLVAMADEDDEFSAEELWRSGVTILGFNLATLAAQHPELVGHALRRAVEGLAAGDLRVGVRARFALERAAAAHRQIESGPRGGRIVLAIGG